MEGAPVILASACLALLAAFPGPLQRGDLPANDPRNCPYCQGDPALMAQAGLVSHGGFGFGRVDTGAIDGRLPTSAIRWIESAHFEIGVALGPFRVGQEDKEKLRGELAELERVLPAVDPRTKVLDPWLRAHLFAQRAEQVWQRMLEILRVEESDFPDGKTPWMIGQPYHGEGPYMGQVGKYEVLILPSEAGHVAYLRDQFGLTVKKTQRWNLTDTGTISVTIHTEDADLRDDTALHCHLAFNLAVNLLDGYEHYSYDTPCVWREGLAHYVERQISPEFNSFDASEGAIAEMTRKSDWATEVRKMIQADDVPRLAEMLNLKTYAEFKLRHHFASWSMVGFLIEVHPEGWAGFNAELHGRKDPDGFADGSNLLDFHREVFTKHLGMSYVEFDIAWREWALLQKDREKPAEPPIGR